MIYTHNKLFFLFAYLGITVCTAISCQQSVPDSSEDTLARVGNKYLTVQQAAEDIPDFVLAEDSINALYKYREDWIRQQLMQQEANRLGLSQNEEVQQKLQKARNEVLRQALRDYIISSQQENMEISDNEARSYYQANKEQFLLEEDYVKFRHLKTQSLTSARSARQDLLDGVPWPEVAREYSINPEVAINESEQFWPISMAAKNIDIMNRYLNRIGQNEISPIQRVNGIYHFVQMTETRSEGELPDLEWLIEQIKDWMVINNHQRNFSSYVKNLYLKAKSNNEVETFNVLPAKSNQNPTVEDTLESNSTNE
jgi:hypothetical protein